MIVRFKSYDLHDSHTHHSFIGPDIAASAFYMWLQSLIQVFSSIWLGFFSTVEDTSSEIVLKIINYQSVSIQFTNED